MIWKANFNGESSENSLYSSECSDIQLQQNNSRPRFPMPSSKKLSYDSHGTDEDEEVRFIKGKENHPDTSILVDARKTDNFHVTDVHEVSD